MSAGLKLLRLVFILVIVKPFDNSRAGHEGCLGTCVISVMHKHAQNYY